MRISPWRVLVAAERSDAALVSRQAHATVANGSFNAALYLHYIGLLVICSKIKFCYKGLS